MRIKHMCTLKEQQKPSSWTYLDTYWLAKDLYNLSLSYNYLNNKIKASNPKTPCYYDLIDSIKNKTIPLQR